MGFDMSDYIDVAERIRIFREKYPEGSLQPANVAHPFTVVQAGGKDFVAFTAAAYRTPDDPCPGVGTAWEPVPGPTQFTKDSELQNAETAAWGRAIVAALAADTKHVASADEVRNRQPQPKWQAAPPEHEYEGDGDPWGDSTAPVLTNPASEKQQKAVFAIAKKRNMPVPNTREMSADEASAFIKQYGDRVA